MGKKAKVTGAATPAANAAPSAAASTNSVGEALAKAGTEEGLAALLMSNEPTEEAEGMEGGSGESPENEESLTDRSPGNEEGAEETDTETTETTEEENSESGDPKAEKEEGPEGEGEETASEEEEGELPERAQEILEKRIGREVAKRKRLEEEHAAQLAEREREVEELRGELERRGTGSALPASANPFENVGSLRDLERQGAEAERIYDFADDQLFRLRRDPEGVVAELKAQGVKLADEEPGTAEEYLARVRRNAEKAIRQHIPKRREYLKVEQEESRKAEEVFPFWKDRKSKGYEVAQRVVEQVPEIKRFPNYKAIIGFYVFGLQKWGEEAARAKARNPKAEIRNPNGAPKVPPPKPPVLNGGGAAPGLPNGKVVKQTAARKRFQESGSVDDLAALIQS